MNFKEKKKYLLNALYQNRFDGRTYDVFELLNDIVDNLVEAKELARSINKEGLVKFYESKDGIHLEINSLGIEHVEDNNHYSNNDLFTLEEKTSISKKLDKLFIRLNQIEKGQEIIYDDLSEEFKELRKLLEVLNKKNWRQILKGKLVEAGLGTISNEVSEVIIDLFKDQKLLQ
jgi:hypothetical protein